MCGLKHAHFQLITQLRVLVSPARLISRLCTSRICREMAWARTFTCWFAVTTPLPRKLPSVWIMTGAVWCPQHCCRKPGAKVKAEPYAPHGPSYASTTWLFTYAACYCYTWHANANHRHFVGGFDIKLNQRIEDGNPAVMPDDGRPRGAA